MSDYDRETFGQEVRNDTHRPHVPRVRVDVERHGLVKQVEEVGVRTNRQIDAEDNSSAARESSVVRVFERQGGGRVRVEIDSDVGRGYAIEGVQHECNL